MFSDRGHEKHNIKCNFTLKYTKCNEFDILKGIKVSYKQNQSDELLPN